MSGTVGRWGGIGLDLDRDQAATGEFGEQVDLEAALLLAHVVQARSGCRSGEFGADLGDDERIEQSPEQVAVS